MKINMEEIYGNKFTKEIKRYWEQRKL